ncbi:tetratricopeptide repeat protein [Parasalinivibrio latis]|uniref:tetratricopeptide repeat protein n=1 Tax=Parasalinivibrio latis TaxID=2952610 RepID=UPI003DA5856C
MLLRQLFAAFVFFTLTSTQGFSSEEVQEVPPPSPAQPVSYSQSEMLDRPLMERYILDELKSLRQEYQALEKRMIEEITDRELSVADKSMNYANVTVTYFFYLIAGAASLIALVGWQSLREVRNNTQKAADERLDEIAALYEKKFQTMERELRRKTRIISENNREIEKINEIHNLWLRAQHSQTPEQRIESYNDILKIRPGDLEALTHKADAAMEMGEFNWALSICNRVLEVDEKNANALYQRACAHTRLGAESQAISDLELAISHATSLKDAAREEQDFEALIGNDRFEALIESDENRPESSETKL